VACLFEIKSLRSKWVYLPYLKTSSARIRLSKFSINKFRVLDVENQDNPYLPFKEDK
jgi:hypothetical protein